MNLRPLGYLLRSFILRSGDGAVHRETWPTVGSLALLAENHLTEFLTKALGLLRIGCVSEMFRKFKEGLFLLLFRFDTFFEKFHQHSAGAQALPLCHAPNLGSHFCGKRHALANNLVSWFHDTSMHHNGVMWRRLFSGAGRNRRTRNMRRLAESVLHWP